jgi:glycosyltransferase involved in cell wall biosynthesis
MSSSTPFVSILTPTYNRRAFLPTLIECYSRQTYPLTQMEWIVYDDGTDSVNDIFEEASKRIPNIRYYRSDTKRTIGAKRNFLNDKATGDICIAMDDDDYYFPDRVAHVVYRFRSKPMIDLAGSSELYYFFHDVGGPSGSIYRFGPLHPNHATNGTLAYRIRYARTHRYDETVSHAEEPSFLDDYKHPMIQLDPFKTMIVMAHNRNTYDKKQMIGTNPHLKQTNLTLKTCIRDAPIRNAFLHIVRSLQEPSNKQV